MTPFYSCKKGRNQDRRPHDPWKHLDRPSEGHVAVGRRFGVSAPGKPKGKDPCPRESRNPDHRNPEMAEV
jgi:hypothetical protein